MFRYLSLPLFLVLVVGGGSLIGASNTPGEWYQGLVKPSFNPPDAIFAPVWTALYILVAIAGWRVWSRKATGGAMTVWWLQLGLNFLWSPVFFTLHATGVALAVILALLAAILAFILITWTRDRVAAFLFLPYAAWVAFATLLNFAIFQLN
ncbi:TspO/MBR family protein [Mesorhizobium sp. CAU 1741]|uniref:TspO/MBR family protein n=1 Tax=Mesorhizobium sp. CAU 1741 TaxID=3140366 RepID=UPI00325AEABF